MTALALVIALGTGAYAGLGGTTAWRLESNDRSYASLRMHDLRVKLPAGAFVPQGSLLRAVEGIPDAPVVDVAVERLIAPTLVDASTGTDQLLLPGEVVGMPSGVSPVDALHVEHGQGLAAGDPALDIAVLEAKFASGHGLPPNGKLRLSTGTTLEYVGTGYTPEYFQVTGRSGMVLGETGYAVVFAPITVAQRVTGHVGQVNDLVVRVRPGTDQEAVRRQLTAALAPVGGTVSTRAEDPVHRALYEDAQNDQTTWNVFAFLILFGAAFATFNLISRMIESQRREIGVGMALGVPPRLLAVRPMLVGVQIAVVGVLTGIGVGWLIGRAMGDVMADLLPLPIWVTSFQVGRFAQAAALGLVLPVIAAVVPTVRAVRMHPVEAIRTGAYKSARPAGRLLTLLSRTRLPGRTYLSMALRNVLRTPRRTVFTALGIAAAMTSLVAVLGLLDTFTAAGDAHTDEVGHSSPGRLVVTLDTYYPLNSAPLRALREEPAVAASQPQLAVPATLLGQGADIESVVQVVDFTNKIWTPTLLGDRGPKTGIVLSEKAAQDLGLAPGNVVELRHPVRSADGFRLVTSRIPVRALHPDPWRTFAYLDVAGAGQFGLTGTANQVLVMPAGSVDELERAVFGQPGVSSVDSAAAFADVLDNALAQFTGILRVIEIATLLLALLIAFNTAGITADERTREHATMFAFGLPPRVVMGIAVGENAVIGLLGTLAGIAGGYAALRYITSGLGEVTPDLMVRPTLSTTTVVAVLLLGTSIVALAPLLGLRRQQRMDIPAALRVVE
ncbi:ABC transporter permease [Kribbella sindirgiensis]|uniref:ABC transporter permease n=1 Tax=Kribbella sindirgiensis TaxID=1124744 RepID=A0A4R0I0E7_9ACTN|nr:ABC transporter permease [Kribbella sindirgiensis]TCC20576.1 ABC transporter permease [Kribbella sindirgiensis]